MALTRRLLAATAAAALAWPGIAAAQAPYPERAITLVVPNAAGGAADSLARAIAEMLSRQLGQTVVVENLGGASGALGAQRVLRAAPDGYTLLFGTTSDMVVTPIANRSAGYSARDFTPIAQVGVTPMTLVARPSLGIASAEQLAQQARQRPNGLSVGTTGNASLQAFAAVAMQRAAGIDLLGVPYKGGAPLLNDLLGVPYKGGAPLLNDLLAGQLDLGLLTLPAALPQVRAGKLTMLGVLSAARLPIAPEQPLLGETAAFKGVVVEIWAAIAGPRGLPAPVVDRLAQALKAVLDDREFTERRARQGDLAVPWRPPAEFGAFLAAEDARYRALATGLKLE